KIDPLQLYNDGYTNVILQDDQFEGEHSTLPFNLFINHPVKNEPVIKPEEPANLIIKKDNRVKYVVVNGFVIDVSNTDSWSGNSIVYRCK
ncbi:MAG: hypothetical protein P8X47_13175, partial [Ignavibacteriaceae bacterium]